MSVANATKIRNDLFQKLREYLETLPPLNERMKHHMSRLETIFRNPVVESAFNDAIAHVHPYTETGKINPWKYADKQLLFIYFRCWFTDLPKPTSGLGFILPFSWLYLNNYQGFYFLNLLKSSSEENKIYKREIFNWTAEFIQIRGEYMDSPESTTYIEDWVNDPNTHIEDFKEPHAYSSYNAFFTRELNESGDPRPIASPESDTVVAASADTILNMILSNLTLTTKIDVKGRQISMESLLDKSAYAEQFVGGTAISCVLMPNVYHHYHAPVSGNIVEGKEVPGIYNGVMDGEHWFNDMSNPGQGNTDFSIFEDFHRAYYVIETPRCGFVAVVPVGLNTISRITPSLVGKKSTYVEPGGDPIEVKKGDRLGHFAYGGSMTILMFEKGRFPCLSVLMGNRIGEMVPKDGM